MREGTGLAPPTHADLCTYVFQHRPSLEEDQRMSRAQWFLLGAVVIGVAVFVYLIFFCPVECH